MTYDIELREMYYVLIASQERNFTRAAERCFITQPALSKAVKKVENVLGVVIFNRETSPLEITAEGQKIIALFQDMWNLQENLENYCDDVKRRRHSELVICAPSYFCSYILPNAITAFQAEYAEWNIRLLEANPNDMLKLIESGIADVGICVGTEIPENVLSDIWQKELLILAVPTDYSINLQLKEYALNSEILFSGNIDKSTNAAVPLSYFQHEPFILLKKDNDSRARIESMCTEEGFTPHIIMEMDQLLTAFSMAAAGKGLTIVRAGILYYMEDLCKNLTFYKIASPDTHRPVQILTSNRTNNKLISQNLVQHLKSYLLPN